MMMALVLLVLLPTMDTCTLRSAGSRRGQSPCLRWPARMAAPYHRERVGRGPSSPTTSCPLWRLARRRTALRNTCQAPSPRPTERLRPRHRMPTPHSVLIADRISSPPRANGRPPCSPLRAGWPLVAHMIQLPQYDRVARVASSSVSWLLVKKRRGLLEDEEEHFVYPASVCCGVCECYVHSMYHNSLVHTLTALSNQNGVCSGVIYTQGNRSYFTYSGVYVRPIHTTAVEKSRLERTNSFDRGLLRDRYTPPKRSCSRGTSCTLPNAHPQRVQRARHCPLTARYRQLTYRYEEPCQGAIDSTPLTYSEDLDDR